MKALLDWLDDRTGYRALVSEALYENIPGGSRWRYVWGSTLVFTFMVQMITGIFLWMAYSPSAQTAWESVYFIQYQMHGGWLLRGIHHFTAQAMVVLLVLHLMQIVIDGAYRAPREVNFWIGLILMQIVLALSLTGYLLPWDQKGYWATRVATNLMGLVPVVGTSLQQIVVGGADYGHHTLTRFFALHAGVLPGLLVMFLALHIYVFRRHGICHKLPPKCPDTTFWPDQVLKDSVACLAVLAVVLFLVVWSGRMPDNTFDVAKAGAELGAPADPASPYDAARPEWYFLFLFQFLKLFEGYGERGEFIGALVVPGVVMFLLALMPIVGRWKLGHRFNIGLLIVMLVGIGLLTGAAVNEDHRASWTDKATFAEVAKTIKEVGTSDEKIAAHFQGDKDKIARFKKDAAAYEKYRKSESYLLAVENAEQAAERVRVLASGPNLIPTSGAVTLLRNDPKTQGAELFPTKCGGCHSHSAPGKPASADTPTAGNLHGFASRDWLAGLLDPKRIGTADYFGATKHAKGDMVGYITGDDFKALSKDDVTNIVYALSAEAALPAQAQQDASDVARIEAGRKIISSDEHCGQCHKFRGGGNEGGPELTGYGSKQWLSDFISNPAHERFYGENNDRMPAFAKSPGDARSNVLDRKAIGLLADWLRGDWYEPGEAAEKPAAAE